MQSVYIPKANASLRVQTHCEIHSVAWCELVAVLKAYSSFREEFITHLELAYNLGHEEEEDEIILFNEEINAGSRRLSNARSTFSSRSGVDKLERTGSPTFMINGQIPQQQHSPVVNLHSRHPAGGSEPRIHTLMPSIHSTLPSLHSQLTSTQDHCTHGAEVKVLEKRIDKIEARLIAMQDRLTANFEIILSHLRRNSSGGSAPDLRNTNV